MNHNLIIKRLNCCAFLLFISIRNGIRKFRFKKIKWKSQELNMMALMKDLLSKCVSQRSLWGPDYISQRAPVAWRPAHRISLFAKWKSRSSSDWRSEFHLFGLKSETFIGEPIPTSGLSDVLPILTDDRRSSVRKNPPYSLESQAVTRFGLRSARHSVCVCYWSQLHHN